MSGSFERDLPEPPSPEKASVGSWLFGTARKRRPDASGAPWISRSNDESSAGSGAAGGHAAPFVFVGSFGGGGDGGGDGGGCGDGGGGGGGSC